MKYFIRVTSEIHLEDDEALQEYLEVRKEQWGEDRPEEIERLVKTGNCVLTDEDGTTTIQILKVEGNDETSKEIQ